MDNKKLIYISLGAVSFLALSYLGWRFFILNKNPAETQNLGSQEVQNTPQTKEVSTPDTAKIANNIKESLDNLYKGSDDKKSVEFFNKIQPLAKELLTYGYVYLPATLFSVSAIKPYTSDYATDKSGLLTDITRTGLEIRQTGRANSTGRRG
jgi:hypothetical protein